MSEIRWKKESESTSSKGPHRDYHSNLVFAENFCREWEGRLVEGVKCKVTDSQWIKKCLLTISWTPPREAPIGNFANHVNLHQESKDCQKEAKETLRTVQKTAETFLDRYRSSKQGSLKFDALKA